MDKYDKALHDMATPFVDTPEKPAILRKLAKRYTIGMLEHETEMTPALHWSLCTSLAEYLHYVEHYPLYKIKAGYYVKEDKRTPHIWLELPDGIILDPNAPKHPHCTHDLPDDIAILYLGKKPEWYE